MKARVLLSAYACEPGRGSEPEVGWQWARHLSTRYEVTVLTRSNNRRIIFDALNSQGLGMKFLFHDLNPLALALKHFTGSHRLYYALWQSSAARLLGPEIASGRYKLAHHLTFASFRYHTAIGGSRIPTIWGPVGGVEAIPLNLMPWRYPAHLVHELARNGSNMLESVLSRLRTSHWRGYTRVLASTRETLQFFQSRGINAVLFPTVGIEQSQILNISRMPSSENALKLLFVGNLLYLKGVHFAIEALALSGTSAHLTIAGDGPFRSACERMTADLGLRDRITFTGKVPKTEIIGLLCANDVFMFPSLHDSGGLAALEAMAAGLPVIALDCGGPAVALTERCGFKVPVRDRSSIVAKLAEAIRFYDSHREKIAEHGVIARQRVLDEYLWDRKMEQMVKIYQGAMNGAERILNKK